MTAGIDAPHSLNPVPLLPVQALLPAVVPPAVNWYEQRKQALILAVLPRLRYRLAVEPGCGEGRVTVGLAQRCDRVLASDRDETVLDSCRQHTREFAHVEVRSAEMPAQWPEEIADLIVLSEIGYHLPPPVLDDVVTRASQGLALGGTLVAAHRRDTPNQFALTGDDVHAHLFGRSGLSRVGGYADEELRIDVFVAE